MGNRSSQKTTTIENTSEKENDIKGANKIRHNQKHTQENMGKLV